MRREKEFLTEKMCASAGVVIHLLCRVARRDRSVRVCACSRGGRCKAKVMGCLVGRKLA